MNMKSKIVVLEDEEYIAKLLVYKLSTANYDVRLFESPENVLEELEKEKPNLIISDIMMPFLNGVEFLKKIKLNELLKDIPVILLTALGDEDAVLIGLNAGAADYITKPFSSAELLLRIKRALGN